MGNLCNSEPAVITEYGRINDISLPFANTSVTKFNKAVVAIGKTKFTVDQMAASFSSRNGFEEWEKNDHWREGSDLINLLSNYLPNKKEGKLDKLSVQCLGLLWCKGDRREKAHVLFQIINPEELGQKQD